MREKLPTVNSHLKTPLKNISSFITTCQTVFYSMYTFEILMAFPFRFRDNEKNGRGNREKLHKSAKDFYAYILLYHYRLIFSP